MLLGILRIDVLLHIRRSVKLDHIHVALDAQAVSLRRVAVGQQAGLDGVVPLSGAVHLEVPQVGLQLVIRGGGSADLDGGNAVLVDVHIARLSYFVAVGNPLVGDAVGVDLRGAYGDVLGIGAAHLLACHHIHKLDGDGDGDRLIDGGQLHIAFGDTKEIRSLSIGEAIQGLRGQLHTIISHPVRELLILRGSDFGDSPDDLVVAGVGNIFRLRIIEAIRPGALTVVELQGDGLCSLFVDGLNVQILEEIAVFIYSPIVYVAGQSRIIKCADTRSIRCLPAGKRCTCRRSSCGLRIGRSQRSSGIRRRYWTIDFSKYRTAIRCLEGNINGVNAFHRSEAPLTGERQAAFSHSNSLITHRATVQIPAAKGPGAVVCLVRYGTGDLGHSDIIANKIGRRITRGCRAVALRASSRVSIGVSHAILRITGKAPLAGERQAAFGHSNSLITHRATVQIPAAKGPGAVVCLVRYGTGDLGHSDIIANKIGRRITRGCRAVALRASSRVSIGVSYAILLLVVIRRTVPVLVLGPHGIDRRVAGEGNLIGNNRVHSLFSRIAGGIGAVRAPADEGDAGLQSRRSWAQGHAVPAQGDLAAAGGVVHRIRRFGIKAGKLAQVRSIAQLVACDGLCGRRGDLSAAHQDLRGGVGGDLRPRGGSGGRLHDELNHQLGAVRPVLLHRLGHVVGRVVVAGHGHGFVFHLNRNITGRNTAPPLVVPLVHLCIHLHIGLGRSGVVLGDHVFHDGLAVQRGIRRAADGARNGGEYVVQALCIRSGQVIAITSLFRIGVNFITCTDSQKSVSRIIGSFCYSNSLCIFII